MSKFNIWFNSTRCLSTEKEIWSWRYFWLDTRSCICFRKWPGTEKIIWRNRFCDITRTPNCKYNCICMQTVYFWWFHEFLKSRSWIRQMKINDRWRFCKNELLLDLRWRDQWVWQLNYSMQDIVVIKSLILNYFLKLPIHKNALEMQC